MSCSVEEQKQLVEAAKVEYKRLADLQSQGYDVDEDNGILDIESAMKDMHAIIQRRPDKLDAFKGTDKPELLANMLKANGDNGTLAMSFNGSNDSKSATPSRLTEDNGMYILSTDKGTYKFKAGKIQSEPINGKYVVVPAMVLTKQSIQENKLGSTKVTAGFALSDNANKVMEEKRTRSKELGSKVAKLNAKEKAIYSELTEGTKQGNPEYQNYMLNWLKSKTNANISYSKEILGLSNLLSDRLNIIAGTYAKATNHIQILDNVTRADVEKDIRSQLYVNYLESQGKSVEEFNEEIIDVFNTPEANKLINEATTNALKVIEKTKGGHTLVHELIHANTQLFMEQNKEHPATKRIQELYQIALDNQKSIDSAITDTDLIGGYWSNNVDEFVAEGLSNPYVMEALMNVPVEGKSRLSVFKELIKSIVEMLGFKGTDKDNVYELLMDSLMNMVEEQGNPDVSKKMDRTKLQEEIKEYKAQNDGPIMFMTENARNENARVSKNRQLAKKMVEERADKVEDKAAWNKYASKVEKGKYSYDRYSDALRKTIESIASPEKLNDVVGLMLSEVHKDKVIVGDYNYATHTIRIAKEPSQVEIADHAETALVKLYADANKDRLNIDKLTEFVGQNKAKVIQRIIDTIEKAKGGHALTHELIHAGSTRFMMDNPKHAATMRVEELYQEAMSRKEEIQSLVNHGDLISTYWQTSRDEFIAEALSNPGLMYALSQVEVKGKDKLSKGLFAELMSTLISMLSNQGAGAAMTL